MKGTSFQKPLEFKLQTEGESWNQGDSITGSLTVKNHGGEAAALGDIRVHLASGELKKVRAKSGDAFKIIATAAFAGGAKVEPQKEATLNWKFDFDRNSPIMDSLGGPFLIYGKGDALETYGNLQLPVNPSPVIQEFLKTLEIDFRFVRKSTKSRKDGVEVKLDPPAGRGFAMVEQLVLTFCFEGETLEADYVFHVKKVEATAATVDVSKAKRDTSQKFARSAYLLQSGRINHEKFVTAIREALDLVESKVSF